MVDNIDNDLHIESSEITGPEEKYWFNSTIETLDWDKFWSIREIKMERKWESSDNMIKTFSFRIDDASKTLTVDQIKKIMHDEYGYYESALSVSIIGKNNVKESTICTNDDVIHVILDVRADAILRLNNWQQVDSTIYENNWDTTTHNNDSSRETSEGDIEQESPYREMIENQTWIIRYWDKTREELTLTIDDGNKHEDIEAILDMLKEENIQTTFFVKWDRLEKNKDLWQRAIREWHQICCHTYSHYYLNSKWNITSLTEWKNKEEHPDVNVWVRDVKRLLWEDYYKNVLEADKLSSVPDKIRSDLLLQTEILMREEEVRRTLWEAYLQKYKRDFPFIRLPWWHWMLVSEKNKSVREENVEVLKKMWYLSIIWSDDFIRSWSHQDIDHMAVENWWTPLFHFKWKKEQDYIRQYIQKAKWMGKKFKPLSDIIRPTN